MPFIRIYIYLWQERKIEICKLCHTHSRCIQNRKNLFEQRQTKRNIATQREMKRKKKYKKEQQNSGSQTINRFSKKRRKSQQKPIYTHKRLK